MFTRIAIVNRGEAAMRLIHAVRGLSAETGEPIEVVALHTDVDRDATFVREADIAFDLGPAAARPYLNLKVLERALLETGADAAWVGWGFVAEDPLFAELCERIGVTFVGPSPEAMRKLGDKIGAKLIAEEVGVPVAPWSRGAVDTVDEAKAAAAEIGYPLMLKATAGGGGRGIRVVTNDADLVDAYERTRDEAARAFGSGIVFLERLVTGARHVEVQVIADGQGTAWALGVRDCSVQRRNQKIIEESASPVLAPEQVAELKGSAERLAVAVGYRGAATVEFLYHPGEKLFAFLEVNTRLQVEHPVTEETAGIDLVRQQFRIANGEKLEFSEDPAPRGHSFEFRINGEDAGRNFLPAPGPITVYKEPSGPGVRVDSGVVQGDVIGGQFDSMLAKLIVTGETREQALERSRRALAEFQVEGLATVIPFHRHIVENPAFHGHVDENGVERFDIYTKWIETDWENPIEPYTGGEPIEEDDAAPRQKVVVEVGGRRVEVSLPGDLALGGGGGASNGVVRRKPKARSRKKGGGAAMSGDAVAAPMQGTVVKVAVEEGQEVAAGELVVVLEAMKMENPVTAHKDGVVTGLAVEAGAAVTQGTVLLELK